METMGTVYFLELGGPPPPQREVDLQCVIPVYYESR